MSNDVHDMLLGTDVSLDVYFALDRLVHNIDLQCKYPLVYPGLIGHNKNCFEFQTYSLSFPRESIREIPIEVLHVSVNRQPNITSVRIFLLHYATGLG